MGGVNLQCIPALPPLCVFTQRCVRYIPTISQPLQGDQDGLGHLPKMLRMAVEKNRPTLLEMISSNRSEVRQHFLFTWWIEVILFRITNRPFNAERMNGNLDESKSPCIHSREKRQTIDL